MCWNNFHTYPIGGQTARATTGGLSAPSPSVPNSGSRDRSASLRAPSLSRGSRPRGCPNNKDGLSPDIRKGRAPCLPDSLADRIRQGGFTLIEVLIVSAILAIIGSILFGSILGPIETFNNLEDKNRLDHVARFLSRKFEEDLGAMSLFRYNQLGFLLGETETNKDKRFDRIQFTTYSHNRGFMAERESDQAEVGYYYALDPAGGPAVLYRREDPIIDADKRTGGESFPVTDRLSEFRIRYRDAKGEWADTWDTDQNRSLPAEIQVQFTLQDREDHPHSYMSAVVIHG